MSRKDELQAIIGPAQHELNEIEAKERDEKNALVVGKCYKYRNSYGSGKKWWLYTKVLRVVDGGLVVHQFQTDSRGQMKATPEADIFHYLSPEYQEIQQMEFSERWSDFVAAINAMEQS